MKNCFKIISSILIIALLTACEPFSPIVYNIEIANEVVLTADENPVFSFATYDPEEKSDEIVTKLDKDKAAMSSALELISQRNRPTTKVKGIYLNASVAGDNKKMLEIMQHLLTTELNAVVIDVKDDNGRITYDMDSDIINSLGSERVLIGDMPGLIQTLKSAGIYCIARVVSFCDPYLGVKYPKLALKRKDGGVYKDVSDQAWLNPYRQENWEYLIEIGKQCAKAGFDEVQFDYIRFNTDKNMRYVYYDPDETLGRSKMEIITECVQSLYLSLLAENIYVSADVFGSIMSSDVDQQSVGQTYSGLLKYLDYICPMVYPSHYSNGSFGIDYPDTQPYKTISSALGLSKQDLTKNYEEGAHYGIVRPWLQGFSATYLENHIMYKQQQYREEIQAVYDAGYEEWIFWNAAANYDWTGFLPATTEISETTTETETENETENTSESEGLISKVINTLKH